MRRSRGQVALTLAFTLLALNAWAQAVLALLRRSDDPPALTVLQTMIGVAGGAAARGSWTLERWTPAAAVLHALITAGMLVALEPLLDLDRDARGGLWLGAAAVLLFGLWAAWYLRRERTSRIAAPPDSGD